MSRRDNPQRSGASNSLCQIRIFGRPGNTLAGNVGRLLFPMVGGPFVITQEPSLSHQTRSRGSHSSCTRPQKPTPRWVNDNIKAKSLRCRPDRAVGRGICTCYGSWCPWVECSAGSKAFHSLKGLGSECKRERKEGRCGRNGERRELPDFFHCAMRDASPIFSRKQKS